MFWIFKFQIGFYFGPIRTKTGPGPNNFWEIQGRRIPDPGP